MNRVVSADSHVVEPPDLWTTRLPVGLRDRGPRVVIEDGAAEWVVEGQAPEPLGGLRLATGRSAGSRSLTHEHLSPGGWDPHARLRDQDHDAVDAEVLYPSSGVWRAVNRTRDAELTLAVYRAYNDWIAEFSAVAPERLIGLGKIPTTGIGDAVAELARCVNELGLKGVVIDAWPSGGAAPDHDADDEFWALAEELRVPVSIHEGLSLWAAPPRPLVGPGSPPAGLASLQMLPISGVYDRHPDLRIVLAHGDASWLPAVLAGGDDSYLRTAALRNQVLSNPDMLPSDYIRRHNWFCFGDDPRTVQHRQTIGLTNLLWASYAPTDDSAWPEDRGIAELATRGVPLDQRAAILGGNCDRLYRVTDAVDFTAAELGGFEKLVLL